MYEQIPVSCECGRHPTRLREVGLTANRQLVIYWRCSHCRRHMYIVKPLAECWRDCPTFEASGTQFPTHAEGSLPRRGRHLASLGDSA